MPHTGMECSEFSSLQPQDASGMHVRDGSGQNSMLALFITRYFAKWLARPNLQELAINKPCEIHLWENGVWTRHIDESLSGAVIEQLGHFLSSYVRKPLDATNVTLSCALPDGTRVEMTGPPATVNGYTYVNMRRHAISAFSLDDFVAQRYFENTVHQYNLKISEDQRKAMESQLMPEQHAMWWLAQTGRWPEFLQMAVLEYANILVSGATGSGKTSFIRGLVEMIPSDERLVTVEDTPEMPLPNHSNVQGLLYRRDSLAGAAGGGPKEILQAAMRKTPKRVLLAELRGDEAFYYLQSVLNSGHPGGMTTTHANSPRAAFLRLALLIKASHEGHGLSLEEIKTMLFSLVDVVVQITFRPGHGRRCSAIYYDPMYAAMMVD